MTDSTRWWLGRIVSHRVPKSAWPRARRSLCIMLSIVIPLAHLPGNAFAQGQAASGGLSWDPGAIDISKFPPKGQAFRFSLCENRLLQPTDVSKPCQKSNAKPPLSGGHNADYAFSSGLNALPPGLRLDGFGVLHGTADVDIRKVHTNVFVCVRQLNEAENCGGLGKFAGIGSGSQATATAPPPSSSGSGVGGALLVGGLVVGAVALAAAAASAAGGSSGGSSCGAGFHGCVPPDFKICCPTANTIYCRNNNTCANSPTLNNLSPCGPGNNSFISACQ